MSLASLATKISTFTAFMLAVMKVFVGFISGSVTVLASALDSLLDMAVSMFNMYAVKLSESKADSMFNYGKGKIEGLAALFEGLIISFSALFIIYEGIDKFIHKEEIVKLDYSIYVMVFSVVVTFFLVMFLKYAHKKTGSLVLKSDATHYQTDLISNIAIIVTLIAVKMTGIYQIDFFVSIIIGFYILYSAYDLIKEGVLNLLDVSLERDIVEQIKDIIEKEPLVLGYHCFKTRKAGNRYFVDVHLVLTPDMKLKLAHTIADNIESKIRSIDKQKEWIVTSHLDPYDDEDTNKKYQEC